MFAYNTSPQEESNYRVEIKNGDELSYFEGRTNQDLKLHYDICEFEYKTSGSIMREKALIYDLASNYRRMGINISTIGVGMEFDVQMMTQLAKEGGGSSRFISDKVEMEKIFGSEFDRMAVPIVKNLRLNLILHEGARVLDTWGYNSQILGGAVDYSQPTLHLGDYETILVKYRIPQLGVTGPVSIGTFTATYEDPQGREQSIQPMDISVVITESDHPVTGISDGMVLRSGSMMMYAETLKEIGYLYYKARDLGASGGDVSSIDELLNNAMDLTVAMKKQLLNARIRLDEQFYFAQEIELLDNYIETLGRNIGIAASMTADYKGDTEIDPIATIGSLSQRVGDLCNEIILGLSTDERHPVAFSGFSSRDGKPYPLLAVLDETAAMVFTKRNNINLVERKELARIIEEQKLSLSGLMDTDSATKIGELLSAKYIITGTVIPMQYTLIIFGRLINVESAGIINVAQLILSREVAGDLLKL
jgi:hypothetical protein